MLLTIHLIITALFLLLSVVKRHIADRRIQHRFSVAKSKDG